METLLSMETASTVGRGVRSCRMASSEVLVPMLVGGPGSNVTFVLDVSEDCEADLGSAKRLLIQTLLTKASLRDSLFNIVTSSGEVRSWSHHMLPCALDVVYRALSWIRSVGCGPDRDLLTALTLAFSDPACHTVHLITTAPPPRPRVLLGVLPSLAAGRTLNVFYLQASGGPDRGATEHLQSLSRTTGGRCYVVQDNLERDLEKVTPLCAVDSHLPVTCCCCSASTSQLRCSLGNPLHPLTSCGDPEFFPGCRVLARRQMDGLYHLGTVVQEVQGCRGVWVIEFDHPGPGPVLAWSRRQMVCSLDMVAHTRGHVRRPVPGDTVLSPWQPDPKRCGPGRVLSVTQTEGGSGGWTIRLAGSEGDGAAGIRVLMWDGSVSLVPVGLVWSISVPHHDRIVRELHCGYFSNRCCASRCWSPLSSCYSCRSWSESCSESRSRSWSKTEPRDTDVRRSDLELLSSSSSSSSSSTDDETTAPPPPVVKMRPRPPWRYWRRTGPEPQHRQPGGSNSALDQV
ncbi:uncharacterized protein C11orf16 homolog [Sphaeramia orbicularis]|uniref:uncharacterized protein C11orf16 homolog n=1 Tax=Sphaeramia orbicularis TaxID=375764 RepID=UPI00117FAB01|nr:uncharacterized protein C11orf16 homolog [Sphaeramia orbicularis]